MKKLIFLIIFAGGALAISACVSDWSHETSLRDNMQCPEGGPQASSPAGRVPSSDSSGHDKCHDLFISNSKTVGP